MEKYAGRFFRQVIWDVYDGKGVLPACMSETALPNVSDVHCADDNNLIAIRFKFDNIKHLKKLLDEKDPYHKTHPDSTEIVLQQFQNYCNDKLLPKGIALVRGKENTLLFGCVVKQTKTAKNIMAQIAKAKWFDEIPQDSVCTGPFKFHFGPNFNQWYKNAEKLYESAEGGASAPKAKKQKVLANMGGPNDRCFKI